MAPPIHNVQIRSSRVQSLSYHLKNFTHKLSRGDKVIRSCQLFLTNPYFQLTLLASPDVGSALPSSAPSSPHRPQVHHTRHANEIAMAMYCNRKTLSPRFKAPYEWKAGELANCPPVDGWPTRVEETVDLRCNVQSKHDGNASDPSVLRTSSNIFCVETQG